MMPVSSNSEGGGRMKKEEMALVAPCGINCGDCGVHLAKDIPKLIDSLVARGFEKERLNEESLPCAGCRAVKGNCAVEGNTCETYACVGKRGFDFCFECPDFPCAKLNPAADRADVLPHNTKVFNLCFIQRQGLEKFLEEGAEIKQRYYRGKMEIGKGPQLK
jgi:hypothetical protein